MNTFVAKLFEIAILSIGLVLLLMPIELRRADEQRSCSREDTNIEPPVRA